MGDSTEPPVSQCAADQQTNYLPEALIDAAASTDGCHLSVHVNMSDSVAFVWETILLGRRLFVEVPKFILPDGSKESFVRLLEFAEEDLKCSHIIVCFKKDRPDRASLIRVFMFLGFTVLPPGHPLVPAAKGDILYLACAIDGDGSGDD